jgi:hypothetical protein
MIADKIFIRIGFRKWPLIIGGCMMIFGEWIIFKFAVRVSAA